MFFISIPNPKSWELASLPFHHSYSQSQKFVIRFFIKMDIREFSQPCKVRTLNFHQWWSTNRVGMSGNSRSHLFRCSFGIFSQVGFDNFFFIPNPNPKRVIFFILFPNQKSWELIFSIPIPKDGKKLGHFLYLTPNLQKSFPLMPAFVTF